MASKSISIVIPTYSGIDSIAGCLGSIAKQSDLAGVEVVLIQDGPQPKLERVINETLTRTKIENLVYRILPSNVGRFQARVEGAKIATSERIVFVDDRVELAPDFIKKLKEINDELVLGNVIERSTLKSSLVSETLTQIRKKIYGQKWGKDFKDYYIDIHNFEKAPKGMSALIIKKTIFLQACKEFAGNKLQTKSTSDDTGILRIIIKKQKMLRTNKLKIYYHPRTSLAKSIRHLYERGPKFVDYYTTPGTRFFPILIGYYATVLVIAMALILSTKWVMYLMAASLFISWLILVVTTRSLVKAARLLAGVILVSMVFGAGLLKGTFLKLKKPK